MSKARREIKYQYIKLMISGRSVRETNALMKSVSAGLDKEYADQKDVEDLLSLSGGIKSINQTRNDAQQLAKIRFGRPKPMPSNKAETASQFVTGYKGQMPLSWKRDGNLLKTTKRVNKPRIGSSAGKIGQTRIMGAGRVLKDFKTLIRELKRLQGTGKNRGDTKALQKAYKGFRADITRSVE